MPPVKAEEPKPAAEAKGGAGAKTETAVERKPTQKMVPEMKAPAVEAEVGVAPEAEVGKAGKKLEPTTAKPTTKEQAEDKAKVEESTSPAVPPAAVEAVPASQ
jgi:hypothetical protein